MHYCPVQLELVELLIKYYRCMRIIRYFEVAKLHGGKNQCGQVTSEYCVQESRNNG